MVAETDDLYTRYLRFMEDSGKSILGIIIRERDRELFRQIHKPKSRKEFEQMVAGMEPERRAEYEQIIRTPWEQQVQEGMREQERALHEYETDPAVRARVAKEVEAALGRVPGKAL